MHIFTYGSLMFPAIWQRVVRGTYVAMPATVAGFARYALNDETYPGMVAQSDAMTSGVLYLDVDVHDVAALDAFEGVEYRRDTVAVTLDSGESRMAGTYIFTATQRLSSLPWQPDAFQMVLFVDSYCHDKFDQR